MFRQWCFFFVFFAIGWLVHHRTYIHTHTRQCFFLFFAIGGGVGGWSIHTHMTTNQTQTKTPTKHFQQQQKTLCTNTAHTYIYMYTHTIYSQTKTTQVPNPEAFVLLGEIGYVFRFDNAFFSNERESVCVFFYDRLRLRPPSLFRKRDKKSDAMNTTTTWTRTRTATQNNTKQQYTVIATRREGR